MKSSEFPHILAAILLLTLVAGFGFALKSDWGMVGASFGFSAIIIVVSVLTKKLAAYLLDADVEHELWKVTTYGLRAGDRFKKPIPAGIIFPIFFSLITLGALKFMGFLTYEARALKYRASKRFGFYSYTEMTDWHNCLIGAAGVLAVLVLAVISYFLPAANIEYLAKLSAYYAFWSLLPVSKLDGTQIFFGSKILWSVLASIASIFTLLAVITV